MKISYNKFNIPKYILGRSYDVHDITADGYIKRLESLINFSTCKVPIDEIPNILIQEVFIGDHNEKYGFIEELIPKLIGGMSPENLRCILEPLNCKYIKISSYFNCKFNEQVLRCGLFIDYFKLISIRLIEDFNTKYQSMISISIDDFHRVLDSLR